MPRGRARVRLVSSAAYGEYRGLARRLRDADKELQRQLRRRIRQEADPALQAVRAAAAGVTMTSSGSGRNRASTGLRRRLAAAARVSVTGAGVRFTVAERRVDPRYGKTLTAGSEGRTWRHPVFGNREVWVRQRGRPWFYPTLRREGPAFRRAVERAVADTLDTIEG